MFSYLLLASTVFSACESVKTHEEWRLLSLRNQKSYLQAVRCLQKLPSKIKVGSGDTLPQPTTRYDDFVYSHAKAAPRMVQYY